MTQTMKYARWKNDIGGQQIAFFYFLTTKVYDVNVL